MSLTGWVASYAFDVLFCLWIIRWGGAELLDGVPVMGMFGALWGEESLRLYGWCMLIGGTIWFLVGAFWPDFRF
jgi:hypothetical protein